ncbi:5-oxoprolinase subunit B family protein [Saccharomonospora cyanea]|uniref:Allophanate hydrolase subunit 1 n=1 Tax=Saccharomonospora cyanea NA-134 TaxID=882082 RepID=H5XIQ2_9PSEU|nr:allophanate hydrolase subunit 1 [Saccharomonospora cyanea]EHR59654.1 allophanate hydrolase subunit 1 [Saccharomonospora cyanea NA-134]
MRLLPCADTGLLVELDDLAQVMGLHAALRADPPAGVVDLVPAARTLLVRFDPRETDRAAIENAVDAANAVSAVSAASAVSATETPRTGAEVVEIPVTYDGEDLAEVAELLGLTPRQVVAAHTGASWTVAFGGFAPGFGYLTADAWPHDVPRRGESRTAVPEGAVAVAGPFSGVYPRSSPGGWRLLGRTETTLWDVHREPPALLRPGVRVRFVEVS